MQKDNELLRHVFELEKKKRARQWRRVSRTSFIAGSFSGAIALAIMILIFK